MNTVVHIPTIAEVARAQKVIIQQFAVQSVKTFFALNNIPKPTEKTGEIGRDKELYLSQFGTPVFSNFNVQAGTYTKNGQTYSFDEIFIDVVLFEINQAKNIVSTAIQGRDGKIKEYISDDDYTVNIKGVLTAPNNTFPLDEFVALIKILKAPVSIKVNSWWLEKFGIYNLVVTSYNFSQRQGRFSEQAFEINALSDVPVELNISK